MVHEISSSKDLLAAGGQASQIPTPRHSERKDVEDQAAESQSSKIEAKDLEQALTRVREVFHNVDPRLRFSVDPDLDRVVVTVVNGESGEVIRQIPAQEVLELAKRLEAPTGLLLHQKV